jgi:hypothetical protein
MSHASTAADSCSLLSMQVAWNQVDLGSHMDQESRERLFSGAAAAAAVGNEAVAMCVCANNSTSTNSS